MLNGQMSIFDFLQSDIPQKEPQEEPQCDQSQYRAIKVDEMKVLQEQNFVEICDDSRICISATVKLLDNNMVYWSEWFTYPFLDICKSEKEAEKQYKEHLKNITDRLTQPPRFEVSIPVELEDMYLCVNGIWSCDTYTFRNGAVKI